MRYFDLHCDTMTNCALKDIPLRDNNCHVNLETVRDGITTYNATQCGSLMTYGGKRLGSGFCKWPSAFPGKWRKTRTA